MALISRKEFLATYWSMYPAAESNWLDVSSYLLRLDLSEAPQVVAGRLRLADQNLSIESNSARITLDCEESMSWIHPQQRELPVSLELFSDGDLVAAEIVRPPGDSRAKVLRLLLLAPGIRIEPSTTPEFSVSRSEQWQSFTSSIREYFASQGFIETLTPTLVPSPGTEPFLDPFETHLEIGSSKQKFYLPTSPEFHLKQLLVRGWTKIFEMKTCFRNGEVGQHHQPEFTMLEWYRAFAPLDLIAIDVESLLQKLVVDLKINIPKLRRTTMSHLFAEAFSGFQLRPETSLKDLRDLASREKIEISPDDSFDDLFFRLFLERIEAHLGADGPLLVSHYPPSQAALSRIGPHGFAERFEIYWRGLEIANAFHELNDPSENENRFALDAAKKSEIGKAAVARDENLVSALKIGMPPSGGIALGVDRLFMALYDLRSINETRAFPLIRPY